MDESLDRREGCYRVQEGSRCAESRHQGIWILIVISLAVFTLGANECIAWDSRCFLLGTKLNVNASFLLKVVLVPSGVQGQYPLTLYKWAPFPSVHIFSVRPRALLLPVCFQTNSSTCLGLSNVYIITFSGIIIWSKQHFVPMPVHRCLCEIIMKKDSQELKYCNLFAEKKCAQFPTGQGWIYYHFCLSKSLKETMYSGQTLSLTFSGTSRKYCGYSYITPTLLTTIKYNKHPKLETS